MTPKRRTYDYQLNADELTGRKCEKGLRCKLRTIYLREGRVKVCFVRYALYKAEIVEMNQFIFE